MQTILYTPMRPNRISDHGGIGLQAADVVGDIVRIIIPKGALAPHHHNRLEPLPFFALGQIWDLVNRDGPHLTRFDAVMTCTSAIVIAVVNAFM